MVISYLYKLIQHPHLQSLNNMKAILLAALLLVLITAPPPSPGPANLFTLSFYWAARNLTGPAIAASLDNSIANVLWNDKIILSIVPTDFTLGLSTINVTANVGSNYLSFQGAGVYTSEIVAGQYNALGLGITHVTLVQVNDGSQTNLITNGDFTSPPLPNGLGNTNNVNYKYFQNNIPGWVGFPQIEIAKGVSYNGIAWPDGIRIVELSSDANYQLRTKFTFDSTFKLIPDIVNLPQTPPATSATLGQYALKFQWAATVGQFDANNFPIYSSSQANVLWNNFVLDTLVPQDDTVQYAQYPIDFLSSIQNTLQFSGASTPDGVGLTIANVTIYDSLTGIHHPLSFVNGDFSTPNLGLQTSQSVTNFLGWQVASGKVAKGTTFNTNWNGIAQQVISLDSGTNQRYTANIPVLGSQYGYGVVGPLGVTAFTSLLNLNGTAADSYVWVRADSNVGGVVDSHAVSALQNAQAGGLSTSIYIKLCRGADPAGQVISILRAIDSRYYSILWLKVEPNAAAGCSWDGYSPSQNLAFLQAALTVPDQNSLVAGIFSTSRIWAKFFGNAANSLGQSGKYLLYYGDYHTNGHLDTVQSFSDYGEFAGFTSPFSKQTFGNQTVQLTTGYHAYVDFFYTESWQISQ